MEERWFQMRVVPFDQEDSRHVIIIHENITDSKTAESRLRNILDNAPIGMAILSLDGRFVDANQSLEAITGYSKVELLDLTCEQINHPDDLYLDEILIQRLIQGKQSSYQIEKRFIHKSGSIVWISLTCSILCDEIGVPIYIIKQILNITEKVNIETALKNSEHRLNLIMNNIPALIGYWNKDFINEFGNKAYTEFFGIDSAKLNGMSLRDVVGEDLYRLNLPHIRMALQGKTQNFERTIKISMVTIDIY
jgi:PAS domain S-box-containing protein